MSEILYLERCIKTQRQTLGRYIYQGNQIAVVLELPDLDNKNKISCIPEGTYPVIRRWSPKHKNHFHITNVPGRSMVLIHIANYIQEIEGCQAPGKYFTFLDKDATIDVTNSRDTMIMLLQKLPKEFILVITDKTK